MDGNIHDVAIKFEADWRGKKCGHDYPPEHCPYEGCGYRGAVQQVLRLRAVLSDLLDQVCELPGISTESQEFWDIVQRAKDVLDNSFIDYSQEG